MTFTLEQRIKALAKLGNLLDAIPTSIEEDLFSQVLSNNSWFIPEQTRSAMRGISAMLREDLLKKWVEAYSMKDPVPPKRIGMVMAGNIPGVGFHDLLCVLITGHLAHVKLSSTDRVLIPWIVDRLLEIEPKFQHQIHWMERLQGMDAYIATGSNNSARYFHYYFGKYPHIIRKNRTSVAVLDGRESIEDLRLLATDVLQYFGLGCRNISKLFVSKYQQVLDFLEASDNMSRVFDHHKYANNYDYNKSIFLINNEPHLDNGFLLMRESNELVSPISVVHYSVYTSPDDLRSELSLLSDQIQCTVSKEGWFPGSISFGSAQCPGLSDYADNIDTIDFLLSLH